VNLEQPGLWAGESRGSLYTIINEFAKIPFSSSDEVDGGTKNVYSVWERE
jgi:hypothetical protein